MPYKRILRELIACQRPGMALEQRFYTDPDIYQLELQQIIRRNWILAGHQSELDSVGDFKRVQIASDPVILVRTAKDKIKAFVNVCRHRGSLVCLEQHGNAQHFSCPYHGWTYNLEGHLTGARNMPETFDKQAHGLHQVQLEVLGGLLFVRLSEDGPSLEHARQDLEEPFQMFDFENLKVAATRHYDIPANWKLAVENYQECYHCATAHPEYAKMHTLMLGRKKAQALQGAMFERMAACGLKRIEFDYSDSDAPEGQQGYAYSRMTLFDKYKTGSRDGQPVAPLLGELKDYDGGASDFTFGPVSFCLAYSDHVVAYVFTPVDATNCQCTIYWLVRGDAVPGKDYDPDELIWLWDITTKADIKIIVDNWQGIQSGFYQPGPFSEMEQAEQRWTYWLLHELRKAPQVL